MPHIRFVLLALATLCMVACCPDNGGHPKDLNAPNPVKNQASIKPQAQNFVADVRLQANPDVLDQCTQAGRPVEISWNVSPAQATAVKIWIRDASNERKLWTQGAQSGKQTTGAWVVPGMQFMLEGDQNKVLAQLTIGSAPCNR
jgi:hypothetical protein